MHVFKLLFSSKTYIDNGKLFEFSLIISEAWINTHEWLINPCSRQNANAIASLRLFNLNLCTFIHLSLLLLLRWQHH